jgi:hypothetical protein
MMADVAMEMTAEAVAIVAIAEAAEAAIAEAVEIVAETAEVVEAAIAEAVAAVAVAKNRQYSGGKNFCQTNSTLIDWLFKSSERCYSPNVRNIAKCTKAATAVWLSKAAPFPSAHSR